MSINELLINTVTPIVSICEPVSYDGDREEYCTFLIDDWPAGFADGMPFAMRRNVILNWFLPRNVNPLKKKRKLCKALAAAGFTYPSITNASDEGGQHYVFETEIADGDV